MKEKTIKIDCVRHQVDKNIYIYELDINDCWEYYVSVEGYGGLVFSFGVPKKQEVKTGKIRLDYEDLLNLYYNGYFDGEIEELIGFDNIDDEYDVFDCDNCPIADECEHESSIKS